MNKKIKWVGLILLMIMSAIFDYREVEEIPEETKSYNIVILEGAFLKQGEYRFEGDMTVQQLIRDVGIKDNANLACLNMDMKVKDESHLYLPIKQEHVISLNKASQEELMTLKGIGEKTALKIIDYRKKHSFTCLEDIMNVSGIGERTYEKLRDYLCL